jgi:phosphotransferase system  glucose/maltose/N-acetylglucosamine-specific IIC component
LFQNLFRNSDKNKNPKSSNEISSSIRIAASILLGIVFGYLMNKANVYLAPTIRDQMLFKRFAMIKMFLAAVGMSMLSVVFIILINESLYRKVLNGFIQRNNRINGKSKII